MKTASIVPLLGLLGLLMTADRAWSVGERGQAHPRQAASGHEVRGGARTQINQNRNVNANLNRNSNVNVNRNVNVNHHVDIDVDVDHDYHPWATAAAVTTAAIVTSAVVGSMVRSIPPSCQTVVLNGISYSQCGSTWYMPQMQGTAVTYVVVAPPR